MAVITKNDMVNDMVNKGYVSTKVEAKAIVDYFFDYIAENLEEGNEITIHNFGKFHVVEAKERQGRNPQTGQSVTILAKYVPKFKFGSGVKKAVAEAMA